jgi:tetratricopeptide (TPR) repeat protein
MLNIRLRVQRLAPGLLAVFFLVVGWACSTQKNALPNRLYHSINAKYNGYFNARESYRDGLRRLSDMHVDNYDQVLKVFRYGDEQQAGSIAHNMDMAYQKASIVIRRHSMNIRGVEHNPWIDESFFLIARSHFFKRDFTLANLTFEYIVRTYDSDIKYESKIWMAKCYHETGQFANALQMLERAQANDRNGLLDSDASRLLSLVYADHYIRQESYPDAIPHLEAGIQKTRNKRERTRLAFIQAQVYLESGQYPQAQQTFARVLKMNPSFDLAFQARISMARAYAPGEAGGDFIRSELASMLRDDKNRAYRDQIYYALGELAHRQNLEDEAIENYLRSVEVSEGNNMQKGLSFLRVGEIFLNRPEFLKASVYYDSAMVYLPQHFEDYQKASQKKAVLTALAGNIRIIQREDSLQRLAGMPESAREAVVEEIIAGLREQEREARQREQDMMRAAQQISMSRMQQGNMGRQDGGWYFYNPTAISYGRTEFFGMFGDRPLEDLWRVSNRQTADFGFAMMEDDWDEEGMEMETGDVFDKQTYLRNIPVTPEQKEASDRRIAGAYFNKGMVFKDRLQDFDNAIGSFETLLNRFPDNDRRLLTYYYLYTLLRENGNHSRAEVYKERLIREFPDSDYAQIIGDPNYMENLAARRQNAAILYRQAYEDFVSGRYHEVIQKSAMADTMEIPLALKGQFSYVNALAKGRLGQDEAFREQLQKVVSDYQGTPVHQPATDLLASLGATPPRPVAERGETTRTGETADPAPGDGPPSMFSYNPSSVHFYVFVVESGRINVNEFRSFVNNFGASSFPDRNLTASSIFLDERRQLITVTNFENSESGMLYHQSLKNSEGFSGFDSRHVRHFLISVDNYPVFYQEKNAAEYEAFFRARYLSE